MCGTSAAGWLEGRTAEGALAQAPGLPAAHPDVATALWQQKGEVGLLLRAVVAAVVGAHDGDCVGRHGLALADRLQIVRKLVVADDRVVTGDGGAVLHAHGERQLCPRPQVSAGAVAPAHGIWAVCAGWTEQHRESRRDRGRTDSGSRGPHSFVRAGMCDKAVQIKAVHDC